MIRRAREADLPALVTMGRRFHAHSPFAFVPQDDASLEKTLRSLMDGNNTALLVPEDLSGMIGVSAHPCQLNHAYEVAQEAFWWSEGAHGMALLKAAEQWARDRGAVVFFMGALEDERADRMTKVYERQGYRVLERFYAKVMECR